MAPEYFDFGNGEVVHWDLARIDPAAPMDQQIDELKEDLAQVRFDQNTMLDIGWYPEFSREGSFVVVVIRNEEWESPIYRRECSDMAELGLAVSQAVLAAREPCIIRNDL
jgi:hypothetical protein